MKKILIFIMFSLIIGTSLFSQTPEDPILLWEDSITIWGWSKNGKVGISEYSHGQDFPIFKTIIFDAVNDTVLWEKKCNFTDYYDGSPESITGEGWNQVVTSFNNAVSGLLQEFQNICKQQHNIVLQETDTVFPLGSSFQYKGRTFNININTFVKETEDGLFMSYSVLAETDTRKKTVYSSKEGSVLYPYPIKFVRYAISPHEERALIIILTTTKEGEYYRFSYIGCHLSSGFR